MAHALGMLIRNPALITIFLAHRNPPRRWAMFQRRGQKFSTPGVSDVGLHVVSRLLWAFRLGILPKGRT